MWRTMRGTLIGQWRDRQCGRWLGLCYVSALLLIVTHVALMATERHWVMMGPQMHATTPTGNSAVLVPDDAIIQSDPDHGGAPTTPRSVLGDCPAQQALPPLFLLLVLLLAMLLAVPPILTADRDVPHGWHHRSSSTPPLAPARRRALLQVFLI